MKMSKKVIVMIVLATLLAVTLSGCFGSFTLTKKVYKFNKGIGAEPIQTLAMWAMEIIPVYEFAVGIDAVILNTLEYWTGKNPLAMNDNQQEIKYYTEKGIDYKIITAQNRIDVYEANNSSNHLAYIYNPSNETWSLSKNGQTTIITDSNKDEITLYALNGKVVKTEKR